MSQSDKLTFSLPFCLQTIVISNRETRFKKKTIKIVTMMIKVSNRTIRI